MSYIKMEIKSEDVKVGDIQVLVKGYSGNMNSGTRVEYEIINAERGVIPATSSSPWELQVINFKMRDRKTGRTSKNWTAVGKSMNVWRKA